MIQSVAPTSNAMPSQERWLVTGGAGFIGSHIVEELVRRGHRVRVFDDLSAGRREYLAAVADKVELVVGDIRDLDALRRAMEGVQYVSHQAALRAVSRSMEDPASYVDVNVKGTLHVLMAAKDAGARRVVSASSSSVFGDAKKFPQKESYLPAPISPYAATKLAGEALCHTYTKSFGLEAVSLRYFNVFGPRQDPESQYAVVIPRFITAALRGQPLEVHWDGKQSRDFSYIDNIVHANLAAAKAPKAAGEAFNIGNGRTHSLLDVIKGLERLSGKKLAREFKPKRAGDVRKTMADISKAKRLLGYRPPATFEQGLAKTWEWFKNA